MKLQARTIRTLVFALVFPVWLYGGLNLVIRLGVSRSSATGLLLFLGFA